MAWVDDATFFYVKLDAQHRPYQVWKHVLGTSQEKDSLVFEEPDDLYNVHR